MAEDPYPHAVVLSQIQWEAEQRIYFDILFFILIFWLRSVRSIFSTRQLKSNGISNPLALKLDHINPVNRLNRDAQFFCRYC